MLKRRRNNRRAAADAPRWRWPETGLVADRAERRGVAVRGDCWPRPWAALLNQPIQRVIVTGPLQRVSALDVEKWCARAWPAWGS